MPISFLSLHLLSPPPPPFAFFLCKGSGAHRGLFQIYDVEDYSCRNKNAPVIWPRRVPRE
jgi:hypothetical protein